MILLRKFYRLQGKIEAAVIILGMAASSTLIFVQVVLRYLFSIGIPWVEEVSLYMAIAVTFMAASTAIPRGMHLSLEVLDTILPPRLLYLFRNLSLIAGLAFAILFAWVSFELMQRTARFGQTAASFDMPMWPIYAILPVSGAFMALRFLEALILPAPDTEQASAAQQG